MINKNAKEKNRFNFALLHSFGQYICMIARKCSVPGTVCVLVSGFVVILEHTQIPTSHFTSSLCRHYTSNIFSKLIAFDTYQLHAVCIKTEFFFQFSLFSPGSTGSFSLCLSRHSFRMTNGAYVNAFFCDFIFSFTVQLDDSTINKRK